MIFSMSLLDSEANRFSSKPFATQVFLEQTNFSSKPPPSPAI